METHVHKVGGFKSLHHILDGHFFTYIFVVKIAMSLSEDENKRKEAGMAHFLKNEKKMLNNTTLPLKPIAKYLDKT